MGESSRRGDVKIDMQISTETTAAVAGVHGWHIPRPSLIPSEGDVDVGDGGVGRGARGSASSRGSDSNASTQSGGSGSLLLTAANLAALRREPDADAASLASSTHFTVVNGVERGGRGKPLPSCCCRKHRLPVLVAAMSGVFLVALIAAVLCLEMRSRDMHLFT